VNLFWLLVLVAPVAVYAAVARNQRQRSAERSATVELVVDEFGVRRTMADGREEALDWGELVEVSVFTATKGPHAGAGGAVMLRGDDVRGCLVPLDRLEESGLLEALTRLPGFDVRTLTEAMSAKSHTWTTCWSRSPMS
jgi:hypothetical protein